MALTDAGRNLIASMIVGAGITPFDNTHTYLGVGDSTTPFAGAQTDLQASSNKIRKPMDVSFPTQATNLLTYEATFGTTDAVFTWNEWGIFNASSGPTMLNRKVESPSLGTKPNTQSWVLTVTITINNP
jgi:hypothetical protein